MANVTSVPKAFLAAVIALILWPLSLAAQGIFFPETFRLDNGMQVVVIENDRAPVVTHMVWYKVGAADDPRGKSGLAHFTEHLMFKGTEDVPPQEFSKIVARNGGRDNAFTGHDYTAYFQSIAADRLEMVMELEADRMANLAFDAEIVQTERQVVIEERKQVVESRPERRFSEAMYASLYVHHPYGTPIIGWQSEQETFTLEDARGFYRTWYAPNNAILIVSGAVEPEEVWELAEKTYGKIQPRPVPQRDRVDEPQIQADRRVVFRDPEVRQPSFRRQWLVPGWNDRAGRPHYYAMQVLSEIMGGGKTSRLYQSLVVEQEVATGAGLYYDGDSLDMGYLGLYATPAPGVSIDVVESAAEAALANLLQDGVTAQEVADAKQRLTDQAVFARDSLFGPARIFGASLTTGGSVADVEAWPDRIRAVTAKEVEAAARFALKDRASVTGLLLPEGQGLSQ